MEDRLLRALERLASAEYQEAYIVHGTKDEYVTPEDLVEDVASLCHLAQRPEFVAKFQQAKLTALLEMMAAIRLNGPQLFTAGGMVHAASLVRKDSHWAAIRRAAQKCLAAFGVNPAELRVEDIDTARQQSNS